MGNANPPRHREVNIMATFRYDQVVVGPALTFTLFFSTCVWSSNAQVNPEAFRRTIDGSQVELYTLKNKNGLEATITNYGGIVVSLTVPDKNGKLGDVVLGYETLNDYIGNTPYFGSLIGRYGNRIAKGRFTINGVDYQLAQNNAENSLHGGRKGFDKVVWQAEKLDTDEGPALKLTYTSKDGEENYPGTLRCEVIYTLTNNNELKVEYSAETDKPTFVNLTHHSYFNLKDAGASDILGHELMIKADKFTPVDKGLIPTGELRPVAGTPFDFNKPTAIGARVESDDEQMKFGKGYDHNWVLNRQGKDLELAASLYEPTTGRFMEVLTTEPGLQFYCGNFLDGTNKGKGGTAYQHRTGLCLETQHFPDSPNHPDFPTTELQPGEKYTQTTVYRFSTK
jgi:aldose 1-epimerase